MTHRQGLALRSALLLLLLAFAFWFILGGRDRKGTVTFGRPTVRPAGDWLLDAENRRLLTLDRDDGLDGLMGSTYTPSGGVVEIG